MCSLSITVCSPSSSLCKRRPCADGFFLGILRLELGKESFERTGLTGKPIRGGGRKHAKERYRM